MMGGGGGQVKGGGNYAFTLRNILRWHNLVFIHSWQIVKLTSKQLNLNALYYLLS
jgi:hypothetical protein